MSAAWLACSLVVLGHNPDTSYARVEIGAEQVRTRLTFDVFTLLTIVQLDDDADGQVSREELTRHLPDIDRFLREHVWLAIGADDEEADLGRSLDFLWPPDVGDAIRAADYHSAIGLIHFDFLRPVKEIPEQVEIGFAFFDVFGPRHTVLGVFALAGDSYETTFSRYEPQFT